MTLKLYYYVKLTNEDKLIGLRVQEDYHFTITDMKSKLHKIFTKIRHKLKHTKYNILYLTMSFHCQYDPALQC